MGGAEYFWNHLRKERVCVCVCIAMFEREIEYIKSGKRVLSADEVMTSSSQEISPEKRKKQTLAYLLLRTGYHPLSSFHSSALFLSEPL